MSVGHVQSIPARRLDAAARHPGADNGRNTYNEAVAGCKDSGFPRISVLRHAP